MAGKWCTSIRCSFKPDLQLLETLQQWFKMFSMDQMDVDHWIADGNVCQEGAIVGLILTSACCTADKNARRIRHSSCDASC
jgi:hypothetical protein